MKYVFLTFAAGLIGLAAIPAFSSTVTPQPLAEKVHDQKVFPAEPRFEDTPRFVKLELYIGDSMREWAPAETIAGTHSQSGFDAIARDVVATVLNPGEPALFEGDVDKARTATLLATIALFEGHYWPYVDSGLCNDPKHKDDAILKNGGCDGGEAVSLWQIHPGRGIVLLNNGMYGYRVYDRGSTDGGRLGRSGGASRAVAEAPPSVDSLSNSRLATAESLRDRPFAAKVALHMLRASLKRDGTLREYTGELKPCPKAIERLKFSVEWSAKHPFEATP